MPSNKNSSSSAATSIKKYNTRLSAAAVQQSSKSEKPKEDSEAKQSNYKKTESSDDDYEDVDEDDMEDDDDEDDEDDMEEDSDNEDEDEDSDDEEYHPSDDDADNDELAQEEYQKFLSELFPSTYMSNRVKQSVQVAAAATAPSSQLSHKKTSTTKCPNAPKKSRRETKLKPKNIFADEEEDEAEEDDDFLAKNKSKGKKKMQNYNISFVIGDTGILHGGDDGDYMTSKEALYDEAYSDEDDDYSDDEDDEDDYSDSVSNDEEEEQYIMTPITSRKRKHDKVAKSPNQTNTTKNEMEAFDKIKGLFGNLSKEDQENPSIKKYIKELEKKEKLFLKSEERKTKKQKIQNTKKLKSLLKERDVMNDLQYFNEKLSVSEQARAIQQIEEIKKHNDITKPYRLTLLDADIPSQYKAIAYRKISTLRNMEPGGSDYYKMKNWVDTFMQIPFGKYKHLPISIDDGVEKCHDFMHNAKEILDQAVYGLNDAKLQIMQMVGQWIVNPNAIGTSIAIKGPMGTGKTTLVKEGISKILGRDFVFIPLGGATDSSFLEGHSYTYEGSTWGKIVDLLIKCKSMNPVIYFDELDKISETPKGEEIAGILTHLTDTSQNTQFHDRYFSEIEFDISRCLFIFSYNDESKVNKILLDRMYRIQTQGYNQDQKTTICNKYLLPKIGEQVKFNQGDIIISNEIINYIITNYTDKEDGVRTLKRCLEIIYTKLNLYRLMRAGTNIFENEMSIKVEFPMQVTTEIVDKLIKKNVDNGSWQNMYM
jgi:hypothetical protein